ncbi:MAG: nuclear transport factor 2 family protein [Isosphaeraceae bacterium]|nr:nuclear transport factor 2 family protein [Isosphaeraceae bacterium]
MSEQDNVRVVRELLEAFRRGDVTGVLDRLTDDVECRLAGPTEATRAGTHRGKDQVMQLFRTISEASEFEQFEPQEYIAQGDKVVALGRERQRVKASGQVAEADWAMVFTLRDGKVARFRNYQDVAAPAHP